MNTIKQYLTWIVLVLGLCIGAYGMALYKDKQISEMASQQATQAKNQTDQANALLLEQKGYTEALRGRLAVLEATHYEALTDAKSTIDVLSDDLRAARHRLSIRTTNPVRSDTLPSTGASARLDDENIRADIHPEDAAAIVRLTGEADECAITLTALQERVKQTQ